MKLMKIQSWNAPPRSSWVLMGEFPFWAALLHRYLPGIKLPDNVVAIPDLIEAVERATLLIFVIPHQFVEGVCQRIADNCGVLGDSARAISLIKGLDCSRAGLQRVSALIQERLGLDVSVLMGANVASDIARERFSESTIGYRDSPNATVWRHLFESPYFRISLMDDVVGVELCGALKNIIAVAAGIVDGLFEGGGGDNTKAAIMRRGLLEMRSLCRLIDSDVRDETFLQSCGVADVITSCYGGRNRRVAEIFARRRLAGQPTTIDALEAELLNGQKLQGPATAREVHRWLQERNLVERFPIMTHVYRICYEDAEPASLLSHLG